MYESVDGTLAVATDDVDRILEANALFVHEDIDHIVCVSFGLFLVVRKDVLMDLFIRASSQY